MSKAEQLVKAIKASLAAAIVGPEKFLYCPDYAGEMSATFGNDATEL